MPFQLFARLLGLRRGRPRHFQCAPTLPAGLTVTNEKAPPQALALRCKEEEEEEEEIEHAKPL